MRLSSDAQRFPGGSAEMAGAASEAAREVEREVERNERREK
jgi:hypothetical protein